MTLQGVGPPRRRAAFSAGETGNIRGKVLCYEQQRDGYSDAWRLVRAAPKPVLRLALCRSSALKRHRTVVGHAIAAILARLRAACSPRQEGKAA